MLLNLNADTGESFGAWKMGDDKRLLSFVNSANVACGFHAGDPLVMIETIRLAKKRGVSLGAHPGYQDLQGFGRRPVFMSDEEITALIQYQLAAFSGVAKCHDCTMTHVKPHGALNNMACEDISLSRTIVSAISAFDPDLILLAPACSALAAAADESGLPVALEVFADRAYADDGTLLPRRCKGAVLSDPDTCIRHVREMIDAGGIVTASGKTLKTAIHSICVHGDTPHAVESADRLNKALQSDGHRLVTLPELQVL